MLCCYHINSHSGIKMIVNWKQKRLEREEHWSISFLWIDCHYYYCCYVFFVCVCVFPVVCFLFILTVCWIVHAKREWENESMANEIDRKTDKQTPTRPVHLYIKEKYQNLESISICFAIFINERKKHFAWKWKIVRLKRMKREKKTEEKEEVFQRWIQNAIVVS